MGRVGLGSGPSWLGRVGMWAELTGFPDVEAVPYADDPVADEEWTKQYEKEIEEEKQLQQQHQDRLEKRVAISEWYVLHGL